MNYFNFDSDIISNYLIYNQKVLQKFKKSFNYLIDKIKPESDLTKIKWHEQKNEKWTSLVIEDNFFLTRNHNLHFTVYCKLRSEIGYDYSIFTLLIDLDKVNDDKLSDELYDSKEELFFNEIQKIVNNLSEFDIDLLWNDYAFPREKYIIIKNVITRNHIRSYDSLLFALEELSYFNNSLFAENEMLEKLKTIKVNDSFSNNSIKVISVRTDVVNNYYHGVGLELEQNGDVSFNDVYCLTKFYLETLFKN